MLKADGFDHCILGIAEMWGREGPVIVYDAYEIVETLKDRDGMTHEEAIEFFDFNIAGAYVGEHTPIFVMRCGISDINEIAEIWDED